MQRQDAYLAKGKQAMTTTPAPAMGTDTRSWRCFHCDEVFTCESAAREHFGLQEDGVADGVACQLTKDEKGIVGLLREAWDELRKYHAEEDANYRQFHALGAKHATELRQAEEAGYENGLADGRTAPAPVSVEEIAAAMGGIKSTGYDAGIDTASVYAAAKNVHALLSTKSAAVAQPHGLVPEISAAREVLGVTLNDDFAFWSSPINEKYRAAVWRAYKILEEAEKSMYDAAPLPQPPKEGEG